MSRMHISRSWPLQFLVLFACTTQAEERAVPEQSATEGLAVCVQGPDFVADGSIPVESASPADARVVVGLRWEAYEDCERLVIDLTRADSLPATATGQVRAELVRSLGVVRVHLPGIDQVVAAATDTAVGGRLVRAAYAVRSSEDRSLFVDLHLAGEAEARVTTLSAPARVVVDLRPGGGAVPPPAVVNDRVVLLQPRTEAEDYPLRLTGYARLFEANVVARMVKDGEEAARTFTTASDWTEAWGQYELSFDGGPTGAIELHVGDYSARDGEWEGIVVSLTMRGPRASRHGAAGH